MPFFTLQKWYFDILDGENRYVLFYIARAILAGRTQAFLNLSTARLGDEHSDSACVFLDSRETFWGSDAVTMKCGEIRWTPEATTVRFDSRDLIVHLRYSRPLQDFSEKSTLVIPAPFRSRTVWTPEAIRCLVDGEVSVSNRRYAFRKQNGYIDRLDSNVFPLLSPVRTLLWGRMHSGSMALTFTVAGGERNTWGKMILHLGGRTHRFEDPRMEEGLSKNSRPLMPSSSKHEQSWFSLPRPDGYKLSAHDSEMEIVLSVERLRHAVVSDFVEDQRMANPFLKTVYRSISRNPKGIKFFSKASLTVAGRTVRREFKDVLCIDEFVRFDP